ncbi:MAG: adenylate cyclase [Eubacteriales bacterium]|nr:adenylate cyclase [Eubacteriales bacterium]
MSQNVKSTNLRFNLDKDIQRKAWDYLQSMDKQKFKSYSHVIALSLVEYFDRYYRTQDDPYLETREREERFVTQIVETVEKSLQKSMPVFLAGCIAGISQISPSQSEMQPVSASEQEADVDWDFLGE